MALALQQIRQSTAGFYAAFVLACGTMMSSTIIVAHLAATVLMARSDLPLAVAALVFDILALISLVGTAGMSLTRNPRAPPWPAWISGTALAVTGSALSLATCVSAADLQRRASRTVPNNTLAVAGFGLSIAALCLQALFFAWIWPMRRIRPSPPSEALQEHSSPSRSLKRSLSVQLASLTPVAPPFIRAASEPGSPLLSARSSPRSSVRYSVSQAVRPMTSKTRLILATSLASRDSRSLHSVVDPSLEVARQADEFEDWDTSSVQDSYGGPDCRLGPKTRLETIPGSRPASPARALDGPFYDDVHNSLPEETSFLQSHSQMHNASRLSAPKPASHPSRPGTAKSAIDQSQIHPLFRTESPVPPPLASPGTVITASPYAGQVVSPDEVLIAPRALLGGSRPASPSLLSANRNRTGSFRTMPASPATPEEHPVDQRVPRLPDAPASTLND